MKIRMHFPKTEEGKRAFQEKIAEVHAKMIKDYIEKFKCSPEQKIVLFNRIKEDIKMEVQKENTVN